MSSLIDENQQFIDPLTSTPIVNGYIYIGTNGLDAKLNTITIYSDRDLTTPLSNPQRTDSSGRSVNKIWVPGKYSMKVEDSANVQKLNDLDLGELADTGTTLLTNVQGADTITAEGSPTITTLTDGQLYVFTTILANPGAVTLQIDATTAYPIKKNHDLALEPNDFEANQQVVVSWNSTDSVFELQGNVAKSFRNAPQAVTHNIASDADYTLTSAQESYARIIITDTSVLLTAARNIVCSTTERGYYLQNDTAQTLTFKTSAGTGVALQQGEVANLFCDGTNVVHAVRQSTLYDENGTPVGYVKADSASIGQFYSVTASANEIIKQQVFS